MLLGSGLHCCCGSHHRNASTPSCPALANAPVPAAAPLLPQSLLVTLASTANAAAAAGQSLAKMNYSTVLAALISRFTFHVPEELRGPGALWDLQTNLLTNQPRDTLRMRCVPRPTS